MLLSLPDFSQHVKNGGPTFIRVASLYDCKGLKKSNTLDPYLAVTCKYTIKKIACAVALVSETRL